MTVRFSPLHEWAPWKVVAVGASAGAVWTLALIGIALRALRAAGVCS